MIDKFINVVVRVKKVGIDGVEIYVVYGYLVN